jgi:hypothetical protein
MSRKAEITVAYRRRHFADGLFARNRITGVARGAGKS